MAFDSGLGVDVGVGVKVTATGIEAGIAGEFFENVKMGGIRERKKPGME